VSREGGEDRNELSENARRLGVLSRWLLWHARHQRWFWTDGERYWDGVVGQLVVALPQMGWVLLSVEERDMLREDAAASGSALDKAFGDGYQQCRDELETVLLGLPDRPMGARAVTEAVRAGLDTNSGLQFETREAKIARYNEALRYLLDHLDWFQANEPELVDRLRTALAGSS
jgi:hypothetical protein